MIYIPFFDKYPLFTFFVRALNPTSGKFFTLAFPNMSIAFVCFNWFPESWSRVGSPTLFSIAGWTSVNFFIVT